MELLKSIPEIFIQFVIVLLFSLLIGLEQRRRQNDKDEKEITSIPFGTDRTFAFIGALGFILYVLDPRNFSLFIVGAFILGIFFTIYYIKKIQLYKAFGITKILVGYITYSLGPIVITQPKWFSILLVVSVLILVESKHFFHEFTSKLQDNEFVTLAKFLIIAGVILPILPTAPVSELFNISPYQIWLSLVVVSGISYFSYLLQKFVFTKSGVIMSGILGGLYSSTATTIVLSRKSIQNPASPISYAAAIIVATAMMYFRVLILMYIFNSELAEYTLLYILIMIVVSFSTGFGIYYFRKNKDSQIESVAQEKNPLELKIAVIFSLLFIVFSIVTAYTLTVFGERGLNVLSFIVGFTDIDPFLLNLFQGKFHIGIEFKAQATFQAIISNNILKTICTLVLADKETKKYTVLGIGIITIINAILLFFI